MAAAGVENANLSFSHIDKKTDKLLTCGGKCGSLAVSFKDIKADFLLQKLDLI